MLGISMLKAGLLLGLANYASAKAVFAHYMVGTVTEAHAHKDIDDAIAMGLDAFALNIGDPTQQFLRDSLSHLFGYAEYRNFKLFISMDLFASGNACASGRNSCKGPYDYQWIWDAHKGSSAYYQQNGKPLISTYSSGGTKWTGSSEPVNTSWMKWKQSLAYDMYFMPDFDETQGYYQADPGWWSYWGNVVDGLFSWEAAWPPASGGRSIGDVTVDQPVLKGAHDRGKQYMMLLSPLQYKNAYGGNYYRPGDLNLVTRLSGILGMADKPDLVQIATWNDGPESHYIGNLWPESNSDAQPAVYANTQNWPHAGWQPLLTSFAYAYKHGQGAGQMAPQNGAVAVGAAWYKTIMSNSINCPRDSKPAGFGQGTDALYWSIVMAPGATGYKANVITGGRSVTKQLNPGLNSGSSSGFNAGSQRVELIDPSGRVVMSTSGGLCVASNCPQGIYNENLQVLPLFAGSANQACRSL